MNAECSQNIIMELCSRSERSEINTVLVTELCHELHWQLSSCSLGGVRVYMCPTLLQYLPKLQPGQRPCLHVSHITSVSTQVAAWPASVFTCVSHYLSIYPSCSLASVRVHMCPKLLEYLPKLQPGQRLCLHVSHIITSVSTQVVLRPCSLDNSHVDYSYRR